MEKKKKKELNPARPHAWLIHCCTRWPVTWCNDVRSFCLVTVAAFWATDTLLLMATTTCSQTLTKEVHKPRRREMGIDEKCKTDHKDSKKSSQFRNVEPQVKKTPHHWSTWFKRCRGHPAYKVLQPRYEEKLYTEVFIQLYVWKETGKKILLVKKTW